MAPAEPVFPDNDLQENFNRFCETYDWGSEVVKQRDAGQGPKTLQERQLAYKDFRARVEEILPPGLRPEWFTAEEPKGILQHVIDVSPPSRAGGHGRNLTVQA